MWSEWNEVVDIAELVLDLTLFLVDDPFFIVDDVLVGVLTAGKVNSGEPLISDVIELHLVTLLPAVERAANLHDLMSWAPVVKPKRVWCPLFLDTIKLRLDDSSAVRLATCFGADICVVKLVEIALLTTNDLVKDVDRGVHLGVPFYEEGLSCMHLFMIDVDLVAQTAELLKPSDADLLSGHSSVESVLTQLCILLFVPVGANAAFDREDEVLLLIALKSVATADLAVPLILNHRVFEAASLKGNNRGATDEELVLHDTTRLEQTWHEAEVRATVDQSTISEELLGPGPEAVRVLLLQVPHAMGALGRVTIIHVAGPADQELDLVVVVRDDVLCNV